MTTRVYKALVVFLLWARIISHIESLKRMTNVPLMFEFIKSSAEDKFISNSGKCK